MVLSTQGRFIWSADSCVRKSKVEVDARRITGKGMLSYVRVLKDHLVEKERESSRLREEESYKIANLDAV